MLRMAGKKLWDTNAWRRACTLRAAALAGGLGFIVFWRVCMCSFFSFSQHFNISVFYSKLTKIFAELVKKQNTFTDKSSKSDKVNLS